ncbi:Hypothetical protein PENO1_111530 [Penicillium occitanis (nom. inval.)]|nr:Hypothetical protein PENO1_111530 [Penicillium occitanis (nom. inval.)]PCG88250.1 hypothetical protein PENOC_111830 [Penicillium occitanis (nom. inval.)]
MSLLQLPPEIILLIAPYLSERDIARLLQVHRFLYDVLLPPLYQRHLHSNKRDHGLFTCTATGNVAGVQRFLHYGADVNAFMEVRLTRDANKSSQLCYSVKKPLYNGIQRILLRRQLDLETRLKIPANSPFQSWHSLQTPLNIAANIGNDTLVSLLLSHGASVCGFPNCGPRIIQPAAVEAILSGHESTVRLLLERKSPVQDPDLDRGGLVDWAICRGQVSILKMLLEFGADFNIPHDGMYPLNRAVSSGNLSTDIVRFLLDNGANIGSANGHADHLERDTGRLLDEAIQHGTIDTLRLLLDNGIEIPPKFFHHTIERCTIDVVRLLLEHGFVPDIDTLGTVVTGRRRDILQLLIDTGVDLNMKSEDGNTLLHTAIFEFLRTDLFNSRDRDHGNFGVLAS